MRNRFDVMTLAAKGTSLVVAGVVVAGLVMPVRGAMAPGPVGADCQLMAQALRDGGRRNPVISSQRRCDWRRLGFSNAIVFEDLPAGTETPSRTVGAPVYRALGYRAEVDVGVAWAMLAGEGENCTYYRFWGTWHLAGCEPSWIA